jgi:hypothetical protein
LHEVCKGIKAVGSYSDFYSRSIELTLAIFTLFPFIGGKNSSGGSTMVFAVIGQ